MRLINAQLVLQDRVVSGSLEIERGRIRRLTGRGRPGKAAQTLDLGNDYLAPGFIDLHVHGARGRDTMEASAEAFRAITAFHLEGGTTSMALTTVTAPAPEIMRVLEAVQPLHNRSLGGARIVGVHIEGPFISPQKAGAQDPRFIRAPDRAEWRRYLRYGGLITQMTVAPELPGAPALIRALRRNGSIASGGHTNAAEEHLGPALRAGLNQATHTFNCMSTASKKGPFRVAGMLEFALAHDQVACELIADGAHVAPTLMKMLIRAKGPAGVCLITDAIGGAGMPPGTIFRAGGPSGLEARVTSRAAFLTDGSALAGSTLTMIEAVKRTVRLAEVSLADAVRMASLNPARQLGRGTELGSLAPGKRADLVWFDQKFRVRGVWLGGERLI